MNFIARPGVGIYEGYEYWYDVDPYEDINGPFYWKRTPEGIKCAIEVERRHCNGLNITHGGFLMTYADTVLFAVSQDSWLEQGGVTVSFSSDFCSGAKVGDWLEAEGEVVKETRTLIFVRARLFVGEETVLNFSGIIKKLEKR